MKFHKRSPKPGAHLYTLGLSKSPHKKWFSRSTKTSTVPVWFFYKEMTAAILTYSLLHTGNFTVQLRSSRKTLIKRSFITWQCVLVRCNILYFHTPKTSKHTIWVKFYFKTGMLPPLSISNQGLFLRARSFLLIVLLQHACVGTSQWFASSSENESKSSSLQLSAPARASTLQQFGFV